MKKVFINVLILKLEYKKYYHKLSTNFNRFFDGKLIIAGHFCLTINTFK